MALKTNVWALLLDRPALRATLDALRGYCYPAPVREALCQFHDLAGVELAQVLRLHLGLRGERRGRPPGPAPRDGLDLLLYQHGLREVLGRKLPPLEGLALVRLREKFRLTPAELVRVLNAHAELCLMPSKVRALTGLKASQLNL